MKKTINVVLSVGLVALIVSMWSVPCAAQRIKAPKRVRKPGVMKGLPRKVTRCVNRTVRFSTLAQTTTRPIANIHLVSIENGLSKAFPELEVNLTRISRSTTEYQRLEELLALEEALRATDKSFFVKKEDGIHVSKDKVIKYGSYENLFRSNLPLVPNLRVYLTQESPLQPFFELRDKQMQYSLKQLQHLP